MRWQEDQSGDDRFSGVLETNLFDLQATSGVLDELKSLNLTTVYSQSVLEERKMIKLSGLVKRRYEWNSICSRSKILTASLSQE